jgi:glycine/D-amino acid oxidase-like deaminating enzyme
VVTRDATVRAGIVVNAVEAFAASQPNRHRDVVPLYSLMIATEPLPESFFDEVGLREYETFADGRHLVVYGQRTADNRLAFGGRGAPYHVGSTIEERFDHDRRTFGLLESTLRDMFPSLSASITHRWGGPLGMTRSNLPYCVVDHRTGLAAAGGYTGDGVVLSRLMGEALATWITVGDASPALPCFAQPLSRRWEVEPLRWLGISAGLALAARADASETAGHLHPLSARLLEKLLRTQ